MTVEKICLVHPEDILALQLTCECGAASVVPVAKSGSIGLAITGQCSYCGKSSGIEDGTKEFHGIQVFGEALMNLASNLQGRHLKLSLKIRYPE
jgi:hypothetical protein